MYEKYFVVLVVACSMASQSSSLKAGQIYKATNGNRLQRVYTLQKALRLEL